MVQNSKGPKTQSFPTKMNHFKWILSGPLFLRYTHIYYIFDILIYTMPMPSRFLILEAATNSVEVSKKCFRYEENDQQMGACAIDFFR